VPVRTPDIGPASPRISRILRIVICAFCTVVRSGLRRPPRVQLRGMRTSARRPADARRSL
jgi:hypothetical protein